MNILTAIDLILAVDKNYGIGKCIDNNFTIPWNISCDLKYFQDITTFTHNKNKQNAVIFGRNTWNTINRELPNRLNIVITSNDNLIVPNNVLKFKSLIDAINYCKDKVETIFICGGVRLYEEVLNESNNYTVRNIFITTIDYNYDCNIKLNFGCNILNGFVCHHNIDFNIYDNTIDKTIKVSYNIYKNRDWWHHLRNNNISANDHKYNYGYISYYNKYERKYLSLLKKVLDEGNYRNTRNSKTWSIFGKKLEFDLNEGFPLLTTKKVFFRGIVEELIWFLKGDTNSKHLEEKGVNIWKGNSSIDFIKKCNLPYDEGDIGPMYGWQWNHYGAEYKGMNFDYTNIGFNQINDCLNLIKNDPTSRRILMTTFNPQQAKEGVLYPCHSIVIQWYVEDNKLSMSMYQRSADICCGVPFNIASSALLMHLFTEVINNDPKYTGPKLIPNKLIMNFGDVHMYEEHRDIAIQQILRHPRKFPSIKFNKNITDLRNFKYEDIELIDYNSYGPLSYKMIV